MLPRLSVTTFALLFATACSTSEDLSPASTAPSGPPQSFSALTFNVLCSFCDTENYDSWDERLVAFEDIFERHDPDLLGLQEISFGTEVDQILELRPGYEALYYRASESTFTYPDATILFRSERFELLSSGEYWLSPTPEVPSSNGFAETQLPRLVVWAELRDRSSLRRLYFASTHVDNNAPSQELSAPLILERTAPWQQQMPVMVVGDFNSKPDVVAFTTLTEGGGDSDDPPVHDTQPLATTWSAESNQPEEEEYLLGDRIDHLFIAPAPSDWQVDVWTVDLYRYGENDRYPSDHRAIFTRVTAPEL